MGRKDGKLRPLHVEKAVDVINFKAFKDETNGGEYEKLSGNNGEIRHLTACKYFRTRELKLNGKYAEKNDKTFTAIDFVSGSGEINGEKFVSDDSFFVPCGEEFTVNGNATAILTTENTLKYYAGIDLGGTGIKCGIVDENGGLTRLSASGYGRRYVATETDKTGTFIGCIPGVAFHMPIWGYVLILAGAVVIVGGGGVAIFLIARRKKQKQK